MKVTQTSVTFPFRRDEGTCELCGRRSTELRYVELQPPRGLKLGRGIWVCSIHEVRAQG